MLPWLGIDIGGTRIKAALVDSGGRILESRSVPTPGEFDPFRLALAGLAASFGECAGIGVGCKGIINPESTRVEILPGTLRFLEGMRLADLVERGSPVRADNDARVAMAGEAAWGAARGRRNAIMLTLGTGLGGAAIADGRLLRGATGVAGHLGHVTIEPDGPFCICGNRGCLETMFSAKAIECDALAAIHRGCHTSMRGEIACQQVFEAAEGGDIVAAGIVEGAVRRLGAGLAGLLHIFDPEVVILGGQISAAPDVLLLDPLRKETAWRTRGLLGREVPIVPAQVADRTGVVGAAALFQAR